MENRLHITRYIACPALLLISGLALWWQNGYLAITTVMGGMAYLIWETEKTSQEWTKTTTVILAGICTISMAILGWYVRFGDGFNRPLVPRQLLLGFTIPAIATAVFLAYTAIRRPDSFDIKWGMPWAVWPVLLTTLPAYLTGVLEMTTPFKCTAVVLGLCVIATICGCLSSLK